MSDILEVTETKIVRPVNGVERTFTFLNAYDRAELLRSDLKRRQDARAARKAKLIENLKLAGITGEVMFSELENFDSQFPETADEQDWITLVNNPLEEVAIYAVSLAKVYNGESEAIAKEAALPLADKAKICGLTIVVRKEEATPDPNPQTPAVYTTPAIESNGTSGLPSLPTTIPA